MDAHSIALLGFDRIIAELCKESLSTEGAEYLKSQGFYTDPEELKKNLNLAVSMRKALEAGEIFPSVSFPEIMKYMERISRGVLFLEAEEIANIGIYLQSSKKLKKYIKKISESSELKEISESMPELEELESNIFRIVTKRGGIKDKSIPELKAIGSRLNRLKHDVEALANAYFKDDRYKAFWQTDTPTERDGRLVLPLKANFKGRIHGIVHEVSGSGATLYLEPHNIVEKNNAIREVQSEYRRQVLEILKRLTAAVSAKKESIEAVRKITGFLDALITKARFSIMHRCAMAEYSKNTVKLLKARHPFLGKKVVPVTVSNGSEYRLLIITGPNTGGKTVTLKTIGLLALMNQFAMEIPVSEGSSMRIFTDIFADIGDEQSIEQSLSTYSGHIKNLSHIVKHAGKDSLILLDELGAGTDPEEGVAIAMALLDYFYETEALVFATTHHGILKNYGYSKQGAENASMEFDRDTLSPTFSILVGVPGESHALEIARRTGMPEKILKTAKSYMDDERSDVSELVNSLSERHRKIYDREKEQKKRENELQDMQRRVDLHELKLRQKEMELREKGLKELKELLRTSRSEIEKTIREIREKELTDERRRILRNHLQEIDKKIDEEEVKLFHEKTEFISSDENRIKSGSNVRIRGTNKKGRVLRRDRADKWIVETDSMRVSLSGYELISDSDSEDADKKQAEMETTDFSISREEPEEGPVFELDIRGKRLEEALRILSRQIDRAALYGLTEFSVIHGKGGGILQHGVHDYLRESGLVKDFYFAPANEGGFGKTIVKIN
ncbi:MAG: endonuclease MutS2 [Spirochaetes bacterium]|nr:endonuclease MutS2 [Spirochaetota bacterium]